MEKPLRIVGFGACMISGFPFDGQASFFHHLVARLRTIGLVEDHIASLPGWPVHRARKHLGSKVLSHQPDYVVLQFGTSDAVRDPEARLRRLPGRREDSGGRRGLSSSTRLPAIPRRSATLFDVCRWWIKAALVSFLRVPPKTPRKPYLESIIAMIAEIRAAGAEPIVLTPFPVGDAASNRCSKRYAGDLEYFGKELAFMVVNAHKVLEDYSYDEVWIWNGVHLTERAHALLGRALYDAVWQRKCRAETDTGGNTPAFASAQGDQPWSARMETSNVAKRLIVRENNTSVLIAQLGTATCPRCGLCRHDQTAECRMSGRQENPSH